MRLDSLSRMGGQRRSVISARPIWRGRSDGGDVLLGGACGVNAEIEPR